MVQFVEQRELAGTGHYDGYNSFVLDFSQHLVCAFHRFRFGQGIEYVTFCLVDFLYFLFVGLMTSFTLADNVDCARAGASFM